MPNFLADEIKEYLSSIYGIGEEDRIFQNSKSYFRHEMVRGSKAAGVKRIRVHDLRHSHVSYLIDKGYTALAIADRLGHEAVDITYRYAHLFPTVQTDMAKTMDEEREVLLDECQEQ
jgi:integrase